MQRVSDRASHAMLLVVGLTCALLFVLVRVPRNPSGLISHDGPGYFSYLRSLVFDHDLDFRNEYRYFGFASNDVAGTTATGLAPNPWSIGPALLWSPFYLSAHALSLMALSMGIQADVHGYGLAYQSAVCIATITYVTAGSVLTYRVCRRYFSPYASLMAVAGVYLASSLIHYTVAAPALSHGTSFFTVSLFLYLWHPPRSRTHAEWALLGVSTGLMILVRWQDVLYLSVLAVEATCLIATRPDANRRLRTLREYLWGSAVLAVIGLVVFSPQLLVWNALYGSPIAVPQGSGFFDWLRPELLEYLFSTRHGLYAWHPVMLLATLGFVLLWRRDRRVTAALASALLLQWYLNSAATDWWAHDSFGARRFISATSVLALGMAALTEWTTERFRRGSLVMLLVIIALVGWNFLFELQYSWAFVSYGEALTWDELVVGKFRMVVELIGRVIDLPSP